MKRLRLALLGVALGGLQSPLAAASAPSQAEVEPAASAGASVSADWIELDDDVVVGEGSVVARFGGDRATAERFHLDLSTGQLLLWDGSWTREAGTARFARAEIDLDAGEGELLAAIVEGADGRLRLRGDALRWTAEGTLAGRGLRLTTCDCDAPPWELQAREVTVDDRAAAFRGGLLRLCGLPLLPLPAGRVALAERASGLLPPELGWGRDGLLLGLPVYLVAGQRADLSLSPELRTRRGGRLLAEGRWAQPGGHGQVRLAGGWDGVTGGPRGALDVDQGFADGPWRLAVDGRVEGDATYLSDYGDGFLDRGLPWAETRLTAALGPLRLEHDSLQAVGDTGSQAQRLGAGVLRLAGRRLGLLSLDVGARVDAIGEGLAAWELSGDPVGRAEADLALSTGRELGVLRVEGDVAGIARSWTDGQPWLEGRAGAGAWLPGWLELERARVVGELGLRGAASALAGRADLRLWSDRVDPAWSIGPAASGRLLTGAGVPLSAGGWVAMTADGLQPTGWLRATRGEWALHGTLEGELQDLRLGYDDTVLAVGSGVLHVGPGRLLQSHSDAAWRLPGPLSEWQPGYRALLDLEGGQALSHGPALSFVSRCGCLDARLAATWSADRDVPDIGLSLQVH